MKATQHLLGLCALLQYAIGAAALSLSDHQVAAFHSHAVSYIDPGQLQGICPVYPKPAKAACGVAKKPIGKKALILTMHWPNVTACAGSCLGQETCQSFTYAENSDVCKLYNKTANHMAVKKVTDGTLFYNRDCYREYIAFPFLLQVVAPESSQYEGQFVYADVNDTTNPYFTSYNSARFADLADFNYTENGGNITNTTSVEPVFAILCDGSLLSLASYLAENGTAAYAYFQKTNFKNICFPSNASSVSEFEPYDKLTCGFNATRLHQNASVVCEHTDGKNLYACSSDQYPFIDNSLQISDDDPANNIDGDVNCDPVVLHAYFDELF